MIICSPELGISPDANLGGEVHDRETLKALADLGGEIHIILPWGKRHEHHRNFHFYFLPTPIVFPPWLFNFLIIPYLFWIHFRHHFAILRVHSPNFVGPAAIFFKILIPQVKIVATYHHLEGKQSWADRFLASKFDQIITVSQQSKHDLKLAKANVIPNGVSSRFTPQPKDQALVQKYGLGGKKVLLFLGQIGQRKNIPFLFKVMTKLSDDFVLLVCGTGPQLEKLRAAAPERVIFTGRVSEEEKVTYYNLADVFVYPSKLEGFGLAILEAMACGIVVVTSDLPVFRELIINGQNGFLCKTDSSLWAASIKKIVKDETRVAQIGQGARTTSRKYTWKQAARKQWQIYEKLQKNA